jgi:hypothetical protein
MPGGFSIRSDSLAGTGTAYDLALAARPFEGRIPLDSVLAVESYREATDVFFTLLTTALATAGGAAIAAVAAVAIFGSCPTFYAAGTDGLVLQSEGFSYSIAPLLEGKDFDRIDVSAGPDGTATLELRNEALETHYLNEIKLLAVRHGPGQAAYPGVLEEILVVDNERPAASARDLSGGDHTAQVSGADGAWFETSSARLSKVDSTDLTDRLYLAWPAPSTDRAALVLRMRNSLLSTVLFYDAMLAKQGARSVDWLASDVNQIGPALELRDFFRRHMGVRVAVRSGTEWLDAGRLPDVGPIAWEEVAIEVPVHEADSVRMRLEFVADGWRFDRIALGSLIDRPEPDDIPLRQIASADFGPDDGARDRLSAADDSYLVTGPGMRFDLTFDAPKVSDGTTSYILVTQGYYTEWVRGSWIRENPVPGELVLSDGTLSDVIRDWAGRRREFERQFFETRIPVR